MGMSCFLVQECTRHKCLVFFRSLSICSCSLRLCKALRGFGRYWKSLGGSGMVWKALEGSAGFARFFEALGGLKKASRGFGTLCEVLETLDDFVMFWEALALESFGKLLKSLGRLWEALA